MKDFVKFKFLFNDERTVDVLKHFYNDYEYLSSIIKDLTKDILSTKNISGKKVLIKPNWVRHSLVQSDELCLRTNDSFVLAVLLNILNLKPEKILLGDAPIQGCDWAEMLSEDFLNEIDKLSTDFEIPIILRDFRRMTFTIKNNNLHKDINALTDYIIFDLGNKSKLESVTNPQKNLFRVMDYDPGRMKEAHSPGKHKYCLLKEVFDYDIIISLPKIKTHQKAGITAALKNIVGFNGDKDFLPHHRIGGTKAGGDCYPGRNILRYWSEVTLDKANQKKGTYGYLYLRKLAFLLWKISFPGKYHTLSAGWFGNDTTWRMVMDLNNLIIYGKSDGSISQFPQRTIYSLCDGIIGGQGNGPLFPDPVPLGIISFSNNSAFNDFCIASLMRVDCSRIPLLKDISELKVTANCDLFEAGKLINFRVLNENSINLTPPPGWVGYF